MIFTRRLGAVLLLAGMATTLAAADKPSGDTKKNGPPSDVPFVEGVLLARKNYKESLEKMRVHYLNVGDLEKAKWAEEELRQFHRIPKQAYRLDMEVSNPNMQATENKPEANALYKQAMQYKDKGWGTELQDNQKRAELILQELLKKYPESDKIGDAAYQLGDIYESRNYKQYRRAAMYFERSFQWTNATQSDARIRAARLYDRQLLDRSRAMELYKEVTTHDTDPKRLAEAEKRLTELSQTK